VGDESMSNTETNGHQPTGIQKQKSFFFVTCA